MLSRIAWGCCTYAFEASRGDRLPPPMRRPMQSVGVLSFWVALTLEGRAIGVLRDYRVEIAEQSGGVGIGAAGGGPLSPTVEAWSLPCVPKLVGLGLGRVWVVSCPFCRRFHTHAPEEGCRVAHCRVAAAPQTYTLTYAGDLPRGLWDRFRMSILADRPKLLRDPGLGPPPLMLEAA